MQGVSHSLDSIRKSWIKEELMRIANNPVINALEYIKVRYKSLVCLRNPRLLKPREQTLVLGALKALHLFLCRTTTF